MATYAIRLRGPLNGTKYIKLDENGQMVVQDGDTVLLGISQSARGTESVIADALAIPITSAIILKTTGGDAETLSLANGTPGQIININLDTDGNGAGTLAATTLTGWATIVFADAGDAATLMYIDDTVGWIILGCYGLTEQPTITV